MRPYLLVLYSPNPASDIPGRVFSHRKPGHLQLCNSVFLLSTSSLAYWERLLRSQANSAFLYFSSSVVLSLASIETSDICLLCFFAILLFCKSVLSNEYGLARASLLNYNSTDLHFCKCAFLFFCCFAFLLFFLKADKQNCFSTFVRNNISAFQQKSDSVHLRFCFCITFGLLSR